MIFKCPLSILSESRINVYGRLDSKNQRLVELPYPTTDGVFCTAEFMEAVVRDTYGWAKAGPWA